MAARRGHRARGSLQAEVMAVLWRHPRPVAAAEVRDAVDACLSYNAVHAVLRRLCERDWCSGAGRGVATTTGPSMIRR